MLKTILIFLAGILVGANAVYFLVVRADGEREAVMVFERERSQHAELPPPAAATPAPTTTPPIAEPVPVSPGAIDVPPLSPPLAVAAPLPGAPAATGATPAPGASLIVPVRGVAPSQLSNTFDDARGQNRVHEAIDIMAARGTPVLAVADGKVEKLFDSVPGGLTIYQFEPSGRRAYYYAHLDRYAEGLVEGTVLEQGDVIGYVGSTGNASEDAPHLHFSIFRLGPEKRWWEGTAINPYPVLTGK